MRLVPKLPPPPRGVFRRSKIVAALFLCAAPLSLLAQLFTPGITEPMGSGPTYTPTHYVDAAAANDNGSGTQTSPWKFAPGMPGANAAHVTSPGMVIAFKRGSVWRLTGTWNIPTSGNTTAGPVVYTAYGNATDPLPRITLLEDLKGTSGTWTQGGGTNVYYRTVTGTVERVYVNGVGLGEATSTTVGSSTNWVGQFSTVTCLKVPVPNPNGWTLGSTHNTGIRKSWKQVTVSGTPRLYLYSPTGNPSTLGTIEGIKAGVPYLVKLTDKSHVYLDRIAFAGAMSAIIYIETTGTAAQTNVRVTNCDVRYARWKGISLLSQSSGAFTNGQIKWNRVESGDGPETRPTPDDVDYGWDQIPYPGENGNGGNDGIAITDGVQGWVLAQNDVSNFWHTQIAVGRGIDPNPQPPLPPVPNNSTVPVTTGNIIEHNNAHAENINYGHAFALRGGDEEAIGYKYTDNVARYNYFYDTWSGNSIKGRNNKVYGNLFVGIYGTPRAPSAYERWTADGIQVWAYDTPGGVVIEGGCIAYNTFVNCGGAAVNMVGTSAYTPPKGMLIANNIMAHGGFRCYASSLPLTARYLSLKDGYADTSDFEVDNNVLYSPAGTVVYVSDGTAGAQFKNLAQMEAGEPTWNFNSTADPKFISYSGSYYSAAGDFRLQAISPARGTAIDLTAILPETSGWPDIGCYQDIGPKPFVTAQTLGGTQNSYDGWKGMKITVGSSPIVVTELGRWVTTGNTQQHALKLVNASGATIGSTTIDAAGPLVEQFEYGPLASPVTLSASTVYYIVSRETVGGDFWRGFSSTIVHPSVATVNNAVKAPDAPTLTFTNDNTTPDTCNGPLSFKYYTPVTFVTGQTLSANSYNGFTGLLGMKVTTGSTPLIVTALGRWVLGAGQGNPSNPGNSQAHAVKLIKVVSGTPVTLGSVSVATSGATTGQVKYVSLASPVVLDTNSVYYIASQETSGTGNDYWYGSSTTLNHTPAAAINGAVRSSDGGATWTVDNAAADSCNVPVGFKYY